MKRFLSLILAAAAIMLASCAKEPVVQPQGEGIVTFTAQLPEVIATRASYSDGQTATKLHYYVYDEDNGSANIEALNGEADFTGLKAEVKLKLVTGKSYSIAFWADAPGNTVYNYDAGAKEMTVVYDGAVAQDESRDAFYAYYNEFKVNGPMTDNVILKRPFAQINVGTDDLAEAAAAGFVPANSSMTVKGVYKRINLSNGDVGDDCEVVFTSAAIPAGETFPVDTYEYLGMNYVLVGAEKTTVDVVFDCGAPAGEMTFSQVPVQRNYRTNIYGSLFTDPVDFNVMIDKEYADNDHNVEIPDHLAVADVAAANEALAAGVTNVVVEEAPVEAALIKIPKAYFEDNNVKMSVTIPETDQQITIAYDDQTKAAPEAVDITAPTSDKLIIDLPNSTVTINGTLYQTVESTTADNTLVIPEEVTVGSILVKKGNVEIYGNVEEIAFEEGAGVVTVWSVADAEALTKALAVADEGKCKKIVLADDADVTLTGNIDLGNVEIYFAGKVDLNGNTVNVGNENWIRVEKNLTITNGTIDNTASGPASEIGGKQQKSLIHVTGGEFVLDGVKLINDMSWHWHSTTRPYNSSAVAYWNDAKITVRNSQIYSGEFTLCGMGRGGVNTAEVYLVDSYFESNSSNSDNGQHWAYAMRVFGKTIVIENCEVKGIQGAVSIEECVDAEIRSGRYYTVNSEGKSDAFYPLYITGGAVLRVTGGEFSAAVKRTGLDIEGTSAVVCGDNDTGRPVGSVTITGGKFSGKAYNHVTGVVYEPVEGYVWKAIENGEVLGQQPLAWEVVAAE
ncbi:MAG: DUF6562 domain-containing protein [Candidatus Cryptobacteroides sp.]